MLEETDRFNAISETGKTYVIIEYFNRIKKWARNGVQIENTGPFYETSDGYQVARLKEGIYWIKGYNINVRPVTK